MDRVNLVAAEDARQAPDWEVAGWFGRGATLEGLRGRVVALHAFQMLCPGCVMHGLPQATGILRTFDPADVAVIGLHSVFEHHEAMTPVSLAAFLHEYRIVFPVAVDAHEPGNPLPVTMGRYQLRGTPSLVLIDRQGRLRANVFGRAADIAVGAAIASLVAEAPAGTRGTADEVAGGEDCDDEGCTVP